MKVGDDIVLVECVRVPVFRSEFYEKVSLVSVELPIRTMGHVLSVEPRNDNIPARAEVRIGQFVLNVEQSMLKVWDRRDGCPGVSGYCGEEK